MTKKMLIDAAHPEEVRVAVVAQKKIEDFDFESAARKPLRGNIFLARITRVEPSLQAAFVEYGGNRHGFLAFNEIHPDYYQIPVSDRRALQEAEAEVAELASALELTQRGDEDDDEDSASANLDGKTVADADELAEISVSEMTENDAPNAEAGKTDGADEIDEKEEEEEEEEEEEKEEEDRTRAQKEASIAPPKSLGGLDGAEDEPRAGDDGEVSQDAAAKSDKAEPRAGTDQTSRANYGRENREKLFERYKDAKRKRAQLLRNYKIQEVIKRRQILLVQVVKEERGNKGAALTTYLSLAGRYCVLMPNTARGGGISRKIANGTDRRRLRRVVDSLDVPQGMGLIIRTAGAKRTKTEIKRDYDYLLRLWENIRTLTLKSIAPCLIYEEANLIKRAIRDLYDKDISSVLVEGEAGYREAKDFMKMLMPSHAKNVQPYKEKTPIFLQYGVESQLDDMYQPTVRLKSGGYMVIHQTEALVAIDVNSGRATRERNIEQTALRTNIEAAEEAARQFRLRDLAGLIVIDFIDMEEARNNRKVEKAFKEALKADRARLQTGHISAFGLLELSRQRRRPGIVYGTTQTCPTCAGAGVIRSHEMAALRILRSIEGEAISGKVGKIVVRAPTDVAIHVLNHNRNWINRIEDANGVEIEIHADSEKSGDAFDIEKSGAPRVSASEQTFIRADQTEPLEMETTGESMDVIADEEENEVRRRRRRRSRKTAVSADSADAMGADEMGDQDAVFQGGSREKEARAGVTDDEERPKRRRRRGRRGGRRKRTAGAEAAESEQEKGQETRIDATGDPLVGVEEQRPPSVTDSPEKDNGAPIQGAAPPPPNGAESPQGAPFAEKSPAPAVTPAAQANDAAAQNDGAAEESAGEQGKKSSRKGWWQRATS
jgi:ribonuclease E